MAVERPVSDNDKRVRRSRWRLLNYIPLKHVGRISQRVCQAIDNASDVAGKLEGHAGRFSTQAAVTTNRGVKAGAASQEVRPHGERKGRDAKQKERHIGESNNGRGMWDAPK